jgi:hypothetical protein
MNIANSNRTFMAKASMCLSVSPELLMQKIAADFRDSIPNLKCSEALLLTATWIVQKLKNLTAFFTKVG